MYCFNYHVACSQLLGCVFLLLFEQLKFFLFTNQVQNMIRNAEQRVWCQPGHIRQIITHANCESRVCVVSARSHQAHANCESRVCVVSARSHQAHANCESRVCVVSARSHQEVITHVTSGRSGAIDNSNSV